MGQPSEAERVRGYIVSQANKLATPELVAKVRADSAPLRTAAASVPAARFVERPAADDWSAAEVFTHILSMNESGARSIESILGGGALPSTIRHVVQSGTREGLESAEDYWSVYETRREVLLSRVLQARGDEHLAVKITHSTFGPFSWREWLLFMRVHDIDHMGQLQSIAAHFEA